MPAIEALRLAEELMLAASPPVMDPSIVESGPPSSDPDGRRLCREKDVFEGDAVYGFVILVVYSDRPPSCDPSY